MPKLVLIDAQHAIFFEAAFVLNRNRNPFTIPKRFVARIAQIVERWQPDQLAVIFPCDKSKVWRRDLCPTYRSYRSTSTIALSMTPDIRDWLMAHGVATISHPDHETIDIIASLIKDYDGPVCLDTRHTFAQQFFRPGLVIMRSFYPTEAGRHRAQIKTWESASKRYYQHGRHQFHYDLAEYHMITDLRQHRIPHLLNLDFEPLARLLTKYQTADALIDALKAQHDHAPTAHTHASQVITPSILAARRTLITPRTDVPIATLDMPAPDFTKFSTAF